MSSGVSLLPTSEFLEAIALSQWQTNADYIIGFSTTPARFFSTTNSEWVCLNSESELLGSRFGTALIEPDFAYTRPESSPMLIASNQLKIPDKQLNSAQSIFLYRSDGGFEEIIFNANFTRRGSQTTAPLLDCFSRECMTWFNTNNDWYIGLGFNEGRLETATDGVNFAVVDSSEDILGSIVTSSSQVPSTLVEIINIPSTQSPYISVGFGSGIEYKGTDVNTIFLYSIDVNNDSLVAFADSFESNQTSVNFSFIEVELRFHSSDIVII